MQLKAFIARKLLILQFYGKQIAILLQKSTNSFQDFSCIVPQYRFAKSNYGQDEMPIKMIFFSVPGNVRKLS